jgi:hypothetical protein
MLQDVCHNVVFRPGRFGTFYYNVVFRPGRFGTFATEEYFILRLFRILRTSTTAWEGKPVIVLPRVTYEEKDDSG